MRISDWSSDVCSSDLGDQLSAKLIETLDAGRTKADSLGKMFDETIGRTNDFAEESAPRLVEALIRFRDTASSAAERARETLATVIPAAAQRLETASAEAMKRAPNATDERTERTSTRLHYTHKC